MERCLQDITEEEDNNFDKQHSDQVNEYINTNLNRVNTFSHRRLKQTQHSGLPHKRSNTRRTKNIYERSKKKAPGSIKINIQILQNCTNKTLELKNIFNACLSTGYFPDVLKKQL